MSVFFTIIIAIAVTGAGLITGLLFAFSNFIMRALADLPSDKGMFAMQRINEKIINPLFIVLFLGTPILCLVIVVNALQAVNEPGSVPLLIGAIAYLLGPFGITMLFNVPLNNVLASTDISDAEKAWAMYQVRWQWWNHMRTYIGIASIVFMAIGLGNIES
jgi:uncharacterized membrane protein